MEDSTDSLYPYMEGPIQSLFTDEIPLSYLEETEQFLVDATCDKEFYEMCRADDAAFYRNPERKHYIANFDPDSPCYDADTRIFPEDE